jgi:hypothetical protein
VRARREHLAKVGVLGGSLDDVFVKRHVSIPRH